MFGKNLKYLREKNSMEQLDLAIHLGRKSASTVSEWEKGKYTPKLKTLNEISKLFNVNIDDMMEKDLSSNGIPLDTNETDQVPVLGKIAAGKPLYSEQQILRYSFVPSHINKLGKELFYLEVTGDSMNKEFPEGSEVLVDRNAAVENGNIAVVQINGYDATVKKVRFDDDKIILMPMSTNETHLPQIYTKDDSVTFIGRVIGMFKQY
ncbi:LexA family protein [Macrococcus brunensis]|uniref:LexA family protein n=1 Tax=Macrococcus brunensis TaxID=198483 RepID=UPI001EF0C0BF|nr:XRE family transcriptional regulator [Macrococcus brunensis]ULG73180.1 XRE family transcriptional regulator [Macrococcus brunensis]